MGLVPGGAIMESHADVDDAATAARLQWLECCFAHGKGTQSVNVKHCNHMHAFGYAADQQANTCKQPCCLGERFKAVFAVDQWQSHILNILWSTVKTTGGSVKEHVG